jgi:hypothetical protein
MSPTRCPTRWRPLRCRCDRVVLEGQGTVTKGEFPKIGELAGILEEWNIANTPR